MVKDRLPELRGILQVQRNNSDEVINVQLEKKYGDITQFLSKVEKLRSIIDSIQAHTEEIKHLSTILISLPNGNEKYNFEIKNRKAAISESIKCGQILLKELEQETKKTGWQQKYVTFARIKEIQLATSTHLFMSAIQEYNNALLKHRERCKAIVEQQMRICEKEVTNEELESLLEKNKSAVFVDNIVSNTLEAQMALSQIKERHEELQNIENSLSELRDVFMQIGMLVEVQGDNIRRIEHHVVKAQDYTEHGNKKLEKAKTAKRKAEKRNRVLIIIMVVLLGIIVILLFV